MDKVAMRVELLKLAVKMLEYGENEMPNTPDSAIKLAKQLEAWVIGE